MLLVKLASQSSLFLLVSFVKVQKQVSNDVGLINTEFLELVRGHLTVELSLILKVVNDVCIGLELVFDSLSLGQLVISKLLQELLEHAVLLSVLFGQEIRIFSDVVVRKSLIEHG